MMKKILFLVLLGIIVAVVFVGWGKKEGVLIEEGMVVTDPVINERPAIAPEDSEKESPLQRMQERYVVLKESRKELKLTLSRLGSRLRRAEFAPEKAAEISKLMRKANYSLKNPKLLGAFSNVGEIELETRKIRASQDKLQNVKLLLDEMRKNES